MHELSVASAIANTALAHAGAREVSVVAVQVGSLRQVVSESLRFYFQIVARGTPLEGARLELSEVPARLGCRACGQEWEPDWPMFRCPLCCAAEVSVLGGEELSVEYIEVEERESACIAPE